MKVQEALEKIQRPWLSRISRSLAQGEEVREDFESLLRKFFQLLIQSVNTGNSSWMDDLLKDWVSARTQTDLESHDTSLPAILNQIYWITFETGRENLTERDALALQESIMPVFLHSFEYAVHLEMNSNIQHISQELEEANNNLQRLDKSKSDFIAIAAHELKTPLTLIDGYAAMLRDIVGRKIEADQVDLLLRGIDTGTRRLREIIDDMIDVSLIDNDLLSLNFQPLWMANLISSCKSEFNEVISERGLEFEIERFEGSEEMIFGDVARLFQAFRNLISNAIKFTPDGGRIHVGGRKLPGFLEIIVSDTGIGIDLDDHALIFEKFGQLGKVSLHSSGKTKFKGGGAGLGLSITKGIVEAHGGSIWVESPGYDEILCPGSTFHVLLPVLSTPPNPKFTNLYFPVSNENREDG